MKYIEFFAVFMGLMFTFVYLTSFFIPGIPAVIFGTIAGAATARVLMHYDQNTR